MKRAVGIEVNTCPHCQGRWRVVEQRGADVPALRSLKPDLQRRRVGGPGDASHLLGALARRCRWRAPGRPG